MAHFEGLGGNMVIVAKAPIEVVTEEEHRIDLRASTREHKLREVVEKRP